MASPKHLEILKEGVAVWNEWRQNNGKTRPDLRGGDLGGADLFEANLSDADLSGADLDLAILMHATLVRANLSHTHLLGADLSRAHLLGANLSGAVLHEATLLETDLLGANLTGANLSKTKLSMANLSFATLSGADLSEADLSGANLAGARLTGADLNGVVCNFTLFTASDLSQAVGLGSIRHNGPSPIGIDTIYKSRGEIPDEFLRDAGVPEEIIDVARSLRSGPAIQWHSCFISYSTKDELFARRLHSRMRQANMRVWFAPEDLAGGRKLHEQLFSAIQVQDKLLLILSPQSIRSEWVMSEIRKAREIEKRENRRKLFPIRLVDYDTLRAWTCFDADTGKDLAVEVREYFVPDFSNWKDHNAFEAAFKRLQRDLKSEMTRAGSATPQELTGPAWPISAKLQSQGCK